MLSGNDPDQGYINTSVPLGQEALPLHHAFNALLKGYDTATTRIFIHAYRTPAVAALVWSVFYARIPYVPSDIDQPSIRTQKIFTQVEPRLIFIDTDTAFYREQVSKMDTVVLWEKDSLMMLEVKEISPPVHHRELASVLFTSGTTGVPKGVMIPRANTVAFTRWMCQTFNVNETSRILSVSPLHFDLSVFDFFAPFFSCAALFIPAKSFVMNPQYLAGFIHENRIDTIYATPTWYSLLLQFGKVEKHNFDFVKTILVAGEPFKEPLALALHKTFPQAGISNLYGPTETNVCTYHTLNFDLPLPQRGHVISIGRACPYNEVYLDGDKVLHVKGETVMLGYWPQVQQQNDYATGDIVEQSPHDGLLYFVSRADQMIKRNGYRIEPGEIESCILAYPGISHVAVTSNQSNGRVKLLAHIQPRPEKHLDLAHLRIYCTGNLPAYMMPDEFVVYDALPLTSSGKTDYKKLNEYGK